MDALSIFIPDHSAEFMNLCHEHSTGKLEARVPLLLRRLVALALVRSILVARGLVLQDQIQAIVISHHPSGQPYIISSVSLKAFPCISLSHSGKWVGCVMSNDAQPVGFDLEDYSRSIPRPYMDLANHSFSPTEIDFVKQYGEEGFYRLWTAKEALAKSQGRGLDEALSLDLGAQFLAFFESMLDKKHEKLSFVLTIKNRNKSDHEFRSYTITQHHDVKERVLCSIIQKGSKRFIFEGVVKLFHS